MRFQKHPPTQSALADTRRCYRSPSPSLTFKIAREPNAVFVSEWQQLADGAKQKGYFKRLRGANRECTGRKKTKVSRGCLEWEAKRGRARRSRIIRSLCGPLKRLRRKPTDGSSAARHLGRNGVYTDPHTNTHLRDVKQQNKWQQPQMSLDKGNNVK